MKHNPVSVFFVDACDRELALGSKWSYTDRGYIRRRRGPASACHLEYLHRLIMEAPPGMFVDHINGVKWDNRRANLRLVTAAENGQNRIKQDSRNKTGFRGVTYDAKRGKWIARARKNYEDIYLGYSFESPEEANAAIRSWRLANMPGYTGEHT